jgi:hypothetical protein
VWVEIVCQKKKGTGNFFEDFKGRVEKEGAPTIMS